MPGAMIDAETKRGPRSGAVREMLAGLARLLAAAALGVFGLVAVCFLGRWDAVAALTIIPIWGWALFGLSLALPAWAGHRSLSSTAAVVLWMATLVFAPDEWRGVRRAVFSASRAPTLMRSMASTRELRVVTHNCRAGSLPAAREAMSWRPDVLLLQETRGALAGPLTVLAHELWGDEASLLFGYDTAILARGRLTRTRRTVTPAIAQQFLQATLTLPDGRSLEIASVHLQGHVTDLRLWKRRLWRAHADNQRRHRLALEAIVRSCLDSAEGRPCLIGGDFNAPAGDRAFDALQPGLADAFAEAGIGWGNTFRNDWPVLRIDQIWAAPALKPQAARVAPARHSDHRLVIVDFLWP